MEITFGYMGRAALMTAQRLEEVYFRCLDDDGVTLISEGYCYKNRPLVLTDAPDKTDEKYIWEFAGWTGYQEGMIADESDMTFTAHYTKRDRIFKYTFLDDDGRTVLKTGEGKYGESFEAPEVRDRIDPGNIYTFLRFEGYSEGITLNGNMEFKAVYEITPRTYTYTFLSKDGKRVLKRETAVYGSTIYAPRGDMSFAGFQAGMKLTKDEVFVATGLEPGSLRHFRRGSRRAVCGGCHDCRAAAHALQAPRQAAQGQNGKRKQKIMIIAALSTPHGRGAINVIRLSGDGSKQLAQKMFSPFPDRANYLKAGTIRTELFDDKGMCVFFDAPRSFTGEESVEFHCHGGEATAKAVLERCFALGARPALNGEFSKRAFINGKQNLSNAEGIIDLIDAESSGAAKAGALLAQNELGRTVKELLDALADTEAGIEAALDYPEEELEGQTVAEQTIEISRVKRKTDALLKTVRLGGLIKNGAYVAIVGATNAGKSSLLNALAGEDRAIVSEQHGTTRDTVEISLNYRDLKMTFADTAGFRKTSDFTESQGIERSLRAARRASAVVFLREGLKEKSLLAEENETLGTDCPVLNVLFKERHLSIRQNGSRKGRHSNKLRYGRKHRTVKRKNLCFAHKRPGQRFCDNQPASRRLSSTRIRSAGKRPRRSFCRADVGLRRSGRKDGEKGAGRNHGRHGRQ